MTFSATIPFKPFSKKQREYILAARDNTFNFAEGAVRSGKRYVMSSPSLSLSTKVPTSCISPPGSRWRRRVSISETVTDSDWNIYSGEGVVGENLKIILVFL